MAAAIEFSILTRIGNTPVIELRSLRPAGCARLLLKIEAENPTGSMKDRMALAMIEAAERDGRLRPGGHVVEYTGGSTGVSLAFICAVKGYSLSIVTSDAFSAEKRRHMAAFGADLTIVPSSSGGMDAALTRAMVEKAREITLETGGFWTDQLNNRDQLTAYHRMGEEILDQTGGGLDAFVQATGTAACVRGVSETLHSHSAAIHCVAVEPAEFRRAVGRSDRHPPDRRRRTRLRPASLAQGGSRRDCQRVHRGGDGGQPRSRPARGNLRRHLHGREPRRRPAVGPAARPGGHHRHAHVRFRHEVSLDAALRASLKRGGGPVPRTIDPNSPFRVTSSPEPKALVPGLRKPLPQAAGIGR